MISSLIRLVFYFGVGVYVYRFVNKKLGYIRLRHDPKIIDLCPHCGLVKASLHRCKRIA